MIVDNPKLTPFVLWTTLYGFREIFIYYTVQSCIGLEMQRSSVPVVRNWEYSEMARSIPWLLMSWFFASQGHQQSWHWLYIDGLVQERRNSIANALELRLSFTNSSICSASGSLSSMRKYFNSLRAKFCWGNIHLYLHFMSLLHIDMTQVLEILPQVRPGPTYST